MSCSPFLWEIREERHGCFALESQNELLKSMSTGDFVLFIYEYAMATCSGPERTLRSIFLFLRSWSVGWSALQLRDQFSGHKTLRFPPPLQLFYR